jgi:hypothetical protein
LLDPHPKMPNMGLLEQKQRILLHILQPQIARAS